MSRFFLLFYLIIEIAAFIALGQWIGYGWTVLLIAGLLVFGAVFAAIEFRRVSQRALIDANDNLQQFAQTQPEEAVKRTAKSTGKFFADTAILLVGCILLALPGVVTTAVGFLMVLPPVRWLIRKTGSASVLGWFQKQGQRSMDVVTRYGMREYPAGPDAPASPGAPGSARGFGPTSGFGPTGGSGQGFSPFDRNHPVVPPAPDNAWDDEHDPTKRNKGED